MNAKEPTANCANHPIVPAAYNSIYAGGKPLCLGCAMAETDSRVVFSANGR